MTRDEAKQLLPIIQAFAEGKAIEFRSDASGKWFTTTAPEFNSVNLNRYRIKPEPLECWVVIYADGSMNAYKTENLAVRCNGGLRVIRMVEAQ